MFLKGVMVSVLPDSPLCLRKLPWALVGRLVVSAARRANVATSTVASQQKCMASWLLHLTMVLHDRVLENDRCNHATGVLLYVLAYLVNTSGARYFQG